MNEAVNRIEIRRPDDFHLHLRQDLLLPILTGYSAQHFARAVVMPNTRPPILTGSEAIEYGDLIRQAAAGKGFEPIVTIKIISSTTPRIVADAKRMGVLVGKLYPINVSHDSSDGVKDLVILYPVFAAMEACDMILSLHAEAPGEGIYCLDREALFIPILREIVAAFPRLRIVVEHVTTRVMLDEVYRLPSTVAATITVHHLFLTTNDVMDGKLQPHHYCLPVAKRFEDRKAIRHAALSGCSKFFLGTDSAPHLREAKENSCGCAGIFTAPVAMPLLAMFFDEAGRIEMLEPFTSEFGARFYGLPLNEGRLVLERIRSPTVPPILHQIVPFWHGKHIPWRVVP